jgi:SAM-dependent methyltransferase
MPTILDRDRWNQKHRDAEFLFEPSPFLAECRPHLPKGRALDLACGLGANALYLASEGYEVDAFDWSFEGLRKLSSAARAMGLEVRTVACDLSQFPLPRARYDVLISFRFLDRTLWPAMVEALRPGGALVIETFNERYREARPEFRREYCLEIGELPKAFSGILQMALYQELPGASVTSMLGFRP